MIYPAFIRDGDGIGVTACSDGRTSIPDIARLENAVKHWEKKGFHVIETKNVRTSEKARSSTAKERADQFHALLQDDRITAVFMVSGGEYLLEMLPFVDFELVKRYPKWIQGFSDPTGILYPVTVLCDQATVYASNFSEFGMERWHTSLLQNKEILQGSSIIQHSFSEYMSGYTEKVTGLEEYIYDQPVLWKNLYQEKECRLQGRLLGGCLDVLLNLAGTRYDATKEWIKKYQKDGILWYLESFALNSEQLTLGLWHLREAGWFEGASGFVFGRPAMYESYTGIAYEEALHSVLDELRTPVIYDADIGHRPPRMTVVNGALASITSAAGKGSLSITYK